MPPRLIERLGMAIRIIKVDRATEDHWEYARRNQFWDLKQAYRLNDGDIVVFWRGGSPGKILGQATVVGDVTPLQPGSPHAWSPADSRRGQYAYRVGLADFRELPHIPVTYEQFGFRGQSPVFQVPDVTVRQFVERVGVRVSAADIAFDHIIELLDDSEWEEPTRYDEDHRVRVPVSAVIRRGAPRFRRMLRRAYGGRCAVTRTTVAGVLEAAHISPYKGDHTDRVSNGLLLRSDIHTLFDLHLLTVLPDLTVRIAPAAITEPYSAYDGVTIEAPTKRSERPAADALLNHNSACQWLHTGGDGALF
jgi:hypothetical protein